MKPVADWRRIIRRAWSVRLIALSTVLSAAEFAMQYLPVVSSGKFAALAAVVSIAAAVSRIVAQPSLSDGDK